MEVFLVILVTLLLVGVVGYVGFLYMKEAGPGAPQLWLTGSRKLRQTMGAVAPVRDEPGVAPTPIDAPVSSATPALPARDVALARDDETLRRLKEELHGELRLAASRTREFDARLTRIEAQAVEMPDISTKLQGELAAARQQYRVEIERLQVSLRSVRQRAGSYGQRRGDALASLYGSLARVESSLASVVNPMLLPGEPLTIPAELPAEALNWNTWSDVGESAYTFGDVFNQHRLVLDPVTAADVERFIATLRQALTGSVYPTVRDGRPTPEKLTRMHAGLEAIVTELPRVRRKLEDAYRDEVASDDTAILDA
jgi:hypothetical protein